MLTGDMIVAVATTSIHTIQATRVLAWLDDFPYRPEVLYVLILVWLIFSGPGPYSIDGLIGEAQVSTTVRFRQRSGRDLTVGRGPRLTLYAGLLPFAEGLHPHLSARVYVPSSNLFVAQLYESMFDFPTPIGALPNTHHPCAVGN